MDTELIKKGKRTGTRFGLHLFSSPLLFKKKQLSGTDSRAEPDIKSTKQLFVKKFHFKFGMRAHPDIMCRV